MCIYIYTHIAYVCVFVRESEHIYVVYKCACVGVIQHACHLLLWPPSLNVTLYLLPFACHCTKKLKWKVAIFNIDVSKTYISSVIEPIHIRLKMSRHALRAEGARQKYRAL